MVDPIITPPHPPVEVPDSLPRSVALNPPMVGTASPFERVDGQNRDLILEAIRAWARGPLFEWADGWQKDLIKWLDDTENWLDSWNAEVVRYVQDVLNAVVTNSIDLQDPVLAVIAANPESAARVVLDGLYAGLPEFTTISETVNTGRLSDDQITTKIDGMVQPVYLELARTTAPVRRIEDGLDGVVGGTTVDNTPAIQQIVAEGGRGATFVFTNPGPSATFRIDSTIHATDALQRFMGESGDAYWSHLWTDAPITMIESRYPGTYFERLAFWSGKPLATADAVAIDLYGDSDANVDSSVLGCYFLYMGAGIVHHGKNLIVRDSSFSNSKTGIRVGARDVAYHSEAAWDSRNIFAKNNVFHTMGNTAADAVIDIPAHTPHRQSVFDNNIFNGGSKATDVRVIGTAGAVHRQLEFTANKHSANFGAGYRFDHVDQSSILGSRLTGTGTGSGNGFGLELTNMIDTKLTDIAVRAYSRGFKISDATHLFIRGSDANNNASHGFDFGANINRVLLDSIVSYSNGGYGLTGPTPLQNLESGVVYAYLNTAGQINPSLGIPA